MPSHDTFNIVMAVSVPMGAKSALKSFVGGLILTIVLVVIVPVLISNYISGYIADLVGDGTVLMLSSDIVINLLIWIVLLGFMLVLGAGGILKRFGIFGIIGLVVAYWLLGDVTDAVIPLATLGGVLTLSKTRKIKKEKKNRDANS